jgi:acetyltransferase
LFESIDVILEDENVGIVVFYMQLWDHLAPEFIEKLTEISANTEKTLVVCWAGVRDETKELLRNAEICWFPTPSRMMRAIRNLVHYNERLKTVSKKGNIQKRLTQYTELNPVEGTVNEFIGKKYLKQYGISIPVGDMVTNVEQAVETAQSIGFPVVLKIVSKEISHKSDAGVVKINLKTPGEVRTGFEEIWQNAKKYDPNVQIEGVLVEKMIEEGVEVIMGAVQDPIFGPCIMFGLGGIFVEVLKDVVIKPAPLTKEDAYDMVQSIKGYPILKGIRGKGPYDIEALAETLVKVSEFCMDQQEWLHELDINPVIVHEQGKGVTALDALIVGKENIYQLHSN